MYYIWNDTAPPNISLLVEIFLDAHGSTGGGTCFNLMNGTDENLLYMY